MGRECPQHHSCGQVGEGLRTVGLDGIGPLDIYRVQFKAFGPDGDGPAPIILTHGEQPLETLLDAGVIAVARFYEQLHDAR